MKFEGEKNSKILLEYINVGMGAFAQCWLYLVVILSLILLLYGNPLLAGVVPATASAKP